MKTVLINLINSIFKFQKLNEYIRYPVIYVEPKNLKIRESYKKRMDKQKGIYNKYHVSRADREDRPQAKYIVLRYDKPENTAERSAMIEYAHCLESLGYEKMAGELRSEAKRYTPIER